MGIRVRGTFPEVSASFFDKACLSLKKLEFLLPSSAASSKLLVDIIPLVPSGDDFIQHFYLRRRFSCGNYVREKSKNLHKRQIFHGSSRALHISLSDVPARPS